MAKCIIIGSGIAGLAAAIRMAARSYDVHVFAANSSAGGKFREEHIGDYRFDIGPTILTLPHLIDELFTLHGKDPRSYFKYSRIEQPYRYFFPDGTRLKSSSDLAEFCSEIEANTFDSGNTIRRYLERSMYFTDSPGCSRSVLSAPWIKPIENIFQMSAWSHYLITMHRTLAPVHLLLLPHST